MAARSLVLAVALAAASCEYSPPGECKADRDCSVGTVCQGGVCVSCPGGVCGASATLGAAGGTISYFPQPYSTGSSVTLTFGAGTVPDNTSVSLAARDCSTLPVSPTGGTCVITFDLAASVAQFARPVRVTGSNITTEKASTVLIIARVEGNAWTDVITAIVGAGGTFKTLHASGVLHGITKPGTYVVFKAAPGSPESLFVADFGIALAPDDGAGKTSGLQIISLYDEDGNPLATPTLSTLSINGGDLDGSGLTPDGSQGVMVDGGNLVVLFSGVGSGFPVVSSTSIDVTNFGGDGDSIVIMPDGNEAVVSADGSALAVITGIQTGAPSLALSIPLSGPADGLVMANDGKTMMARGSGSMQVFAITPVPPAKGPLGGTAYHAYTFVTDFGAQVPSPTGDDGRDGMGFDPADGTKAVVVGGFPPTIQLITGLPGSAATVPTVQPPVSIAGAGVAFAVSVTPDGTRAIVGTDKGLAMFTGVDTGGLVQVGPLFNPTFTVAGAPYTLATKGVPTLGMSLDGQYVVAMTPSPDSTNGTLFMFPILSNGFAAAVGQVSGVAVPGNDQIMMH